MHNFESSDVSTPYALALNHLSAHNVNATCVKCLILSCQECAVGIYDVHYYSDLIQYSVQLYKILKKPFQCLTGI